MLKFFKKFLHRKSFFYKYVNILQKKVKFLQNL